MAVGQYVLNLRGACPSKKNNYEIARGRGKDGKWHWTLRINDRAQALIDALGFETNAAAGRAGIAQPLIHPAMTFQCAVSSDLSDRDGALTTVLDLLQQARAIKNDNIRYFNAEVRILPALMCQPGDESITVWLEQQQ